MIYLAYIVIGFTFIQLLVSLVNYIFRQKIPYLKGYKGLISVLIPARNEANNIDNLLDDLLKLDYQNIEILVFDDQSTDNTREIVLKYSASDSRIKLIESTGLPAGWLGKNHACYELSQHARGDYFVFLDADVRIQNNLIERAVLMAQRYNLALLSIFPRQEMKTFGEQITVPFMNYILLTLLPLIQVRRSAYASLSAANGQFMLFKADVYKNVNPHELMKDKKVEDIAIARFYKQKQLKVACHAAAVDISCRMYQNFSESINGFSKNVIMFFGNSFVMAILFWAVTTMGFIPVLFVYGLKGLTIYLAVVLLVRFFVSQTSNQPVMRNILFIIFQQLSLGVVIAKSIHNKKRNQYTWKGRNIA
jgi:glycosyltransferase involved in cell wall biosynthesis